MRKTAEILIIVASTMGLAPTVLAQGAAAPGPTPLAKFDRNADGVVSETEFNQTRAERIAARSGAGAPMRGLQNAPTFSDIDQNSDGKLTADELSSFHAQRMGGRRGMGPGGMGPGGMGPGGMGPGASMGPGGMGPGGMGPGQMGGPGQGPGMRRMGGQMPPFSSFEANSDGLISAEELALGRAERIKERSQQGYPMRNLADAPSFEAIDQNDDGRLDRQEFATAQRQHLLQHQRMMQR